MEQLGPLQSQHKQTLTYPILWTCIAVVIILGSIFVALNGQPAGGGGLAAATTIALVLYLFFNRRQQLFIHENGLRLVKGSKVLTLLWSNVTKVSTSYSHHQHPDTLVDISLRQQSGPRVVLRMNWSNRKQLAQRLWELFPPR